MALVVFSVLALVVVAGAAFWYFYPDAWGQQTTRLTAMSRRLEVKSVDVPPLSDFKVMQVGSPHAKPAKKSSNASKKSAKKKASKKGQ